MMAEPGPDNFNTELPPLYEESNRAHSQQLNFIAPKINGDLGMNMGQNINGNPTLPPISVQGIPSTRSHSQTPPKMDDLVAAEALTRLTSTPPPINNISTPMSNLSIEERTQSQHPLIAKVNQVSQHPIVRDAFKYYENSKRNYPHFNYAAGIVERAALPVVNKIEVNLNNRHRQRLANKTIKKKKKRKVTRNDKNETKKRLQFCLHILKLANEQINNQVNFFQNKITEREIKLEQKKQQEANEKLVSQNEMEQNSSSDQLNTRDAQEAKSEIVTTVKKIVHLISNFKTSNLNSEPRNTESCNELRSTIRDIILKLPSQIQQTTINNNASAQQTNEKIIVFAKESLDMISRLTNVFNEQLEKAESWIGADETESQATSRVQSRVQSRSQSPKLLEFSKDKNYVLLPPPYMGPSNSSEIDLNGDNKFQN